MPRGIALGLCAALVLSACKREFPLPAESELQGLYGAAASVDLNGNVVEVVVRQPQAHLERGGRLWARVGPYVYLFSPETRGLFERYEGVAAVRAITRTPSGREIARATLVRDTVSDVLWHRFLNMAKAVRLEGSDRPKTLYDLVRWGERYTDHRYSYP